MSIIDARPAEMPLASWPGQTPQFRACRSNLTPSCRTPLTGPPGYRAIAATTCDNKIVALFLTFVLAGIVATSGNAARRPTTVERAAIAKAVAATYNRNVRHPASCHVVETVRVSTVDSHYAVATPALAPAAGCSRYEGNGDYYLVRGGSAWHVAAEGSDRPCKILGLPNVVVVDLDRCRR